MGDRFAHSQSRNECGIVAPVEAFEVGITGCDRPYVLGAVEAAFAAVSLPCNRTDVVDDDGYVGVPVDLVKPKASRQLRRERKLDADQLATLLVEHCDPTTARSSGRMRADLRWQATPTPVGRRPCRPVG